jgi:hypothetical protein
MGHPFRSEKVADGHVLSDTATKRAIHLYPGEVIGIGMSLDFKKELGVAHPLLTTSAARAWDVKARPTGEIAALGRVRGPYLSWEGRADLVPYRSEGFVVPPAKTEAFLERSLRSLGLSAKRMSDLVVFWAPKLRKNPQKAVMFLTEPYPTSSPPIVEPKPDREIRVFTSPRRKAGRHEALCPEELIRPSASASRWWSGARWQTHQRGLNRHVVTAQSCQEV